MEVDPQAPWGLDAAEEAAADAGGSKPRSGLPQAWQSPKHAEPEPMGGGLHSEFLAALEAETDAGLAGATTASGSRLMASLHRCCEHGRQGAAIFQFVVGVDGRLGGAHIVNPKSVRPEAAECLVRTANGWTFPQWKRDAPTPVSEVIEGCGP
jgi:hypothetical protein